MSGADSGDKPSGDFFAADDGDRGGSTAEAGAKCGGGSEGGVQKEGQASDGGFEVEPPAPMPRFDSFPLITQDGYNPAKVLVWVCARVSTRGQGHNSDPLLTHLP